MKDLISRQDAIETIRNTLADGMLSSALELRINILPSAQPERKTGRWIHDGSYVDRYDDTIMILRCSCGYRHHYCQSDTSLSDGTWYNYCPNCGAKMEVEHEVD